MTNTNTRRIRTAAAVALCALALAGCSSATPDADATPTLSVEERFAASQAELRLEVLVDPAGPLPAAAPTTAPGTSLAAEQWGVFGREWPSDGSTMTVGLVPLAARTGDLEQDFAFLPDEERAKLGAVTPLYVDYQFALLDGDIMYSPVNAVQLILSDGAIASIPVISGISKTDSQPFCQPEPVVSDLPLEVGDVFSGCKVFLVPDGLTASAVQWGGEAAYATDGVRWPVPTAG